MNENCQLFSLVKEAQMHSDPMGHLPSLLSLDHPYVIPDRPSLVS